MTISKTLHLQDKFTHIIFDPQKKVIEWQGKYQVSFPSGETEDDRV